MCDHHTKTLHGGVPHYGLGVGIISRYQGGVTVRLLSMIIYTHSTRVAQ